MRRPVRCGAEANYPCRDRAAGAARAPLRVCGGCTGALQGREHLEREDERGELDVLHLGLEARELLGPLVERVERDRLEALVLLWHCGCHVHGRLSIRRHLDGGLHLLHPHASRRARSAAGGDGRERGQLKRCRKRREEEHAQHLRGRTNSADLDLRRTSDRRTNYPAPAQRILRLSQLGGKERTSN